uniref:hypothetical protein n=1 Tax=Chishuiella sp. TaxID=1969467 RepID=UPI0028ACA277
MKKILLFTFIVGTLFSCSNDDNSGDTNNNTETENSILPVKTVYTTPKGDYSSISTISYDGNKIKEINITYSGIENYSTKSVYQYTGDLITKISEYDKNGDEDMVREYTYQNGKVSTLVTTEWDRGNPAGDKKYVATSKFEWIDDNHLKETITYDNSNAIYSQEYFRVNGNIVKTIYSGSNSNENIITYDDKNNPLQNIIGYKLISFNEDLYSSKNNPIKRESLYNSNVSDVTLYTYEYNSNTYPSKVTEVYTSSSGNNIE